MDIAVLIQVVGDVQGVGFRAFIEREAGKLGVEGWVRNRLNGDVEALFTGSGESVDALVEVCRRGPPRARVADVRITEADADLRAGWSSHGFALRPTV